MTAVFELRDVHYAYRDAAALAGVDLRVSAGQCVALLGANGSGKSTLLRLLDALYFADRGSVAAFGEVLSEAAMQDDATAFGFRRRVGLVFQNAEVQLFNPTVFDEIAFTLLQFGLPRDEIRARVAASLAAFGIQHLKDRSPNRLSGGEQKRVALASVLVAEPEVLLLDEPTAELDPKSAAEVVGFLGGCRGSGRTVIAATHDLGIVATIADLCVVLDAGRVAAVGPPEAILADAALLARTGLARGPA